MIPANDGAIILFIEEKISLVTSGSRIDCKGRFDPGRTPCAVVDIHVIKHYIAPLIMLVVTGW